MFCVAISLVETPAAISALRTAAEFVDVAASASLLEAATLFHILNL
jgi:hypothetical protein